jgi:hypothetical protein
LVRLTTGAPWTDVSFHPGGGQVSEAAPQRPRRAAPEPPKKATPQRPRAAPKRVAYGMNPYDLIALVTESEERTEYFMRIMGGFERLIERFVLLIALIVALVATGSGLSLLAPSPYAKAVGGAGLAAVSVLSITAWRRIRKLRKLAEQVGHGKSRRSRR